MQRTPQQLSEALLLISGTRTSLPGKTLAVEHLHPAEASADIARVGGGGFGDAGGLRARDLAVLVAGGGCGAALATRARARPAADIVRAVGHREEFRRRVPQGRPKSEGRGASDARGRGARRRRARCRGCGIVRGRRLLLPSRAARPDRLAAYAHFGDSIKGFFEPGLLRLYLQLDHVHESRDVRGALGEIGVYHGKSFVPLALLRRPDERCVAVDCFADQAANVDASGEGDRVAFERNLAASLAACAPTPSRARILPIVGSACSRWIPPTSGPIRVLSEPPSTTLRTESSASTGATRRRPPPRTPPPPPR